MKKLVIVIMLMAGVGSLRAGRFTTFKNPFKKRLKKEQMPQIRNNVSRLQLFGALFNAASLYDLAREPQAVTHSYARVPSGLLVLKEHLD